MKKIRIILIGLLFGIITSCTLTKTTVGNYQEETGDEYLYSKEKQFKLFWGAVPLGWKDAKTPEDGTCEIITCQTFGDVVIYALTGGILVVYTVKVKDKK